MVISLQGVIVGLSNSNAIRLATMGRSSVQDPWRYITSKTYYYCSFPGYDSGTLITDQGTLSTKSTSSWSGCSLANPE